MITQFTLFVNIIAWSAFVLMGMLAVFSFFSAVRDRANDPRAEMTKPQAAVIFRALVVSFIAAAWLCAGRFA